MTSAKQQVGRLALRVEGDFWKAYYALPDSMEDAILLGSIAMAGVQNPARKQAFMDLMKDMVADILEEQTGTRPDWSGAKPAPEHERGEP